MMRIVFGLVAASVIATVAFASSANAGGVSLCNMYPTTDGGQYGQDCAKSMANYGNRIQWIDNRNTPGALAAQGVATPGYAGVAATIGRAAIIGMPASLGNLMRGRMMMPGRLVPVGAPIMGGGGGGGLVCKRTYSDGRVEMYPGRCHG